MSRQTMKLLLPLVVLITACFCDSDSLSQYNNLLSELKIKNPGNTAGLVPYQEKSMKHLIQWLEGMKNYKLSPKR